MIFDPRVSARRSRTSFTIFLRRINPKTISAIKLNEDNAYSKSVSLAVSTARFFHRFEVCRMIRKAKSSSTVRPRTHGIPRRFFFSGLSAIYRILAYVKCVPVGFA